MTPAPLPGDYFDKLEEEQRRRAGQPPASDQPPAPLPGDYFDKLEAKKTPPADEDAVTRWRKAHPTANVLADFAESFGSGVFNTLRGGTQLMRKYIPPIPGIIPEIPEIPESLTKHPESLAGKLGYGAEQAAEFMIPAGGVGKASKGIDAAAQLPKVAKWVGKGVAEGIPAGAISFVQSGGDTKEAATSAGATAVMSMALPTIGNMLAGYLGHTTGAGEYVIKRAAAKPTPELMAAMKGEISEGEVLALTREAIENFANKRSSEYVSRLNQLPRTAVDIRSAVQTAAQTLQDFRVTGHVDPKTGRLILDFDNAVTGDKAAKDQMQRVIDELQNPALRHDTMGIDALKRRVDELYREGGPARAFVAKVRDRLAESLNTQVNGYRDMTSEYAKASKFLDNLADFGTKSKNDGQGIRKLAGALKQNNEFRQQLLEALEPYASQDLLGQLAGSRLKQLAPRGIVGAMHAASGLARDFATGNWGPGMLIGLFGLSPRLVGEAAARARAASRLVKAGTAATPGLFNISGQQPDYDKPTQFAEGGPVDDVTDRVLNDLKRRYLLGGTVTGMADGGKVETEEEKRKRRMIQLSGEPWQPNFTIDAGNAKQNLFGEDRYDPQRAKENLATPAPRINRRSESETVVPQLPAGWRDVEIGAQQGLGRASDMVSRPAEVTSSARLASGKTLSEAMGDEIKPDPAEVAQRQGVGNQVLQFAGGLPIDMVRYGAMTAMTGGNPYAGGFAADVLEHSGKDATPGEALQAGAEGVVMGGASDAALHGLGAGVRGAVSKIPSKEAFQATRDAARQRLQARGAFQGATAYSGPAALQNAKDMTLLTGAQLGSGFHAVGEAAAARARQIRDLMRQGREEGLTVPEQDVYANIRAKNPDIHEIGDYLSTQEAKQLMTTKGGQTLANPQQVEAMNRLLQVLPNAEKMSAMAVAGAPKLGWYRGSAQALQDVFGADSPRFAQLLAALSPRISVEGNLKNALNMWKNWTAAGRPTDRENIIKIMAASVQGSGTEKSAMEAWRNNAVAALSAEDPMSLTLSGPKVNSFQHNLRDHVFHVTNDAWMANAFNVAQDLFQGSGANTAAGNPGMTTHYAGTSGRIRQGAAEAGMFPSQGQETIWSVAMQLYELARKNKITPQEVLQRGMLDKKALTETPDFSTLLRNPEYARILEESGYGKQLEGMKKFMFQQEHAGLTGSQENLLMETAGTISDVMGQRDRASRANQFAVPRGWTADIPKATSKSAKSQELRRKTLEGLYEPTATGVTNVEHVTGAATGHLPRITKLPRAGREYFTNKVAGKQVDLAGNDIIHKAAGLSMIPTESVEGAYVNAAGQGRVTSGLQPRPQDIEKHPGRGIKYEVPLEWKVPGEEAWLPRPYTGEWQASIDPQTQANREAAMAAHAVINAQEAVGSNILVPMIPPEGGEITEMPNFRVPLKKETTTRRIAQAAKAYPGYAFASAGPNMHVLGLGNMIPKAHAEHIQKIFKGGGYVPARNIEAYVDFVNEWKVKPGSGDVTRKFYDYTSKMSPAEYAQLNQDIRQVAGDTMGQYNIFSTSRKTPVRPDLMNLLDIVHKGGLDGLWVALKNGAVLPGLAGAFLIPSLLKPSGGAEEQRPSVVRQLEASTSLPY